MKRWYVFIGSMLVLLVVGVAAIAEAVPAAPLIYTITQPDGSSFEAQTKGDEWHNWIETAEGYSVAKSDDGYWYYVSSYSDSTPVLTNIRANLSPPSALRKHIILPKEELKKKADIKSKINPKAAPNGVFAGKILFILVEFTNKAHTYIEAQFATLLSTNIADFYNKASFGKVTLAPANESSGAANNGVIDWVNVGYAHPNTGNCSGAACNANQQLAKDAILAADATVNFAAFDSNSDGYVDTNELAVVVIAAGYEASYSSLQTPNVWGHQWCIYSVAPPVVDGKTVGACHGGAGGYGMFGEEHKTNGVANAHLATMGIMVHELGHLIFKWVDLYDTDYTSEGIGVFSLMSSGSWGKKNGDTWQGETPVLPEAYSRYIRGWSDGAIGSGTVSITAAGAVSATSANTVFRAATSNSLQYFLVENRQAQGYDRGLEQQLGTGFGGGLAIFHIDESQSGNSNDNNRLVNMETANNHQMSSGYFGANANLWYAGNATTFDNNSTPNSKFYNGASSGISISAISATAIAMTAVFSSVSSVPALDAWSIAGLIALSAVLMYNAQRKRLNNMDRC